MTTIKDLKKELARAEKEANKISSAIAKAELNGKLKCVTDIVLHNEFLHIRISSMPTDEVKILLGEVMNSEEFTAPASLLLPPMGCEIKSFMIVFPFCIFL